MQETGERWRLGHRPALDGLRGVAVLLVVACHSIGWAYDPAGTIGVSIFFTLSGFLITALLLDEADKRGRISLPDFYQRRARRLLPALLVVALLVGAFQVAIGMTTGGELLPILLYGANWAIIGGQHMGLLPHTWSLAIEEQFYLVWPVVILLARRFASRRGLLVVAGSGIALSVSLRFLLWDGGAGVVRVYEGTDTRMDALLIGSAVAVALRMGLRWRSSFPVVTVGLVGLAALGAWQGQATRCLIGPTVTPWVTAAVILAVCSRDYTGWLTARPLVLAGRRSYGLYLWHVPLVYGVPHFLHSPLAVPVALALSVAATWASWRFVEQPFLQARRVAAAPTRPTIPAPAL